MGLQDRALGQRGSPLKVLGVGRDGGGADLQLRHDLCRRDEAANPYGLKFCDIARQAQESYLADPKRPLLVRLKTGEEKLVAFDNRPIQDQVQKCCNLFRLQYDDDENYYVLTKGESASSPLVGNLSDVAEARALRLPLGLRIGIDVVKERIEVLQHDRKEGVVGLFQIVRGDPHLAGEIVELNGIEAMVGIIKKSQPGDEELVELCMATICELTPFRTGIERLRDMEDEDMFDASFYRRLIETLLAPNAAQKGRPPFSVLYGILFFLRELPDAAHALHLGIAGFTRKAGTKDLYAQLGDAVGHQVEEEFQGIAASLVLSAMTLAAEEDEECLKDIKESLDALDLNDPDQDEDSFFEFICSSEHLGSHLLSSAMISCAELTEAVLGGASESRPRLLDKLQKSQRHLDRVTQENSILKARLRKVHGTMGKLSPFVQIADADAFLKDAVDVLLKMGEDSLNLHGGQTILHYAAEHCPNADVIELVGSLLNNPNRQDANGKTPLDYAMKAGHQEVIERLVMLQQGAVKAEQAGDLQEAGRDMQAKLDRLTAVPTRLKEVLEEVLKHGYQREWKNGFTAVHLAAKFGHDGSVSWLAEAGGASHLNESDKWGLTPIDYASQGNHQHTVLHIRKLLLELEQRAPATPSRGIASTRLALPPGRASDDLVGPMASIASAALEGTPTKRPTLPDDLPPKLRKALEVVCQKGWNNIKWPKDFSPLHLAAQVGSVTTVQLLLECSARPGLDMVDEQGKTPLEYALDNIRSPPDLLELLRVGGSDGGSTRTPSCQRTVSDHHGQKLIVPGSPVTTSMSSVRASMAVSNEQRLLQDKTCEIELRHRVAALEKEVEAQRNSNAFGGLPDEDTFAKCAALLESRGNAAVITNLRAPTSVGGCGLSATDAARAMQALELVRRLAKDCGAVAGHEAGEQREPHAEPAAEPAPADDGPQGVGKLGGKGVKGAVSAWSAVVATPDQAKGPVKGKGKGRGVPPPPPGAQAHVGDDNEPGPQLGVEALFGKGNGGAKGMYKIGGPPMPGEEEGEGEAGAEGGEGDDAAEGHPPSKGKLGAKGYPKGGKGPPLKGAPAPLGAPGAKAKPKLAPPTKPSPKPKAKLRKFWWVNDRYKLLVFDRPELPRGVSIWDSVGDDTSLIPLDEFEEIFAEAGYATKMAHAASSQDVDGNEKKKDDLTIIRIIKDGNLVASIESTLKRLPAVDKVAAALMEFDTDVLTLEDLRLVKQYVCPTHEQFAQLTGLKTMNPDVPLAIPEQYMWALGNLGSAKERAECWQFCREAPEDLKYPREALAEFSQVIDIVMNSKPIQQLFGYLLACGNYLNAGTPRGQADGFHIALTFKEAANVKGKGDVTLTRFVIDSLHRSRPEVFKQLIQDVNPICMQVSRAWVKKEGDDELKKEPIILLNEFEASMKLYRTNCERMRATMQQVVKEIADPTDQFRLRMPTMIEQVTGEVTNLWDELEACQRKYINMLRYLRLEESLKSGEFCLLWDDFFIPDSVINKMDSKMKKQFAQPAFVQGRATKPFSVDDLLVLWGIKEFKPPKPPKPPPKSGTEKKKTRGSMARKPINKAGSIYRNKRKAWHSDNTRENVSFAASPSGSDSEKAPSPAELEHRPVPERKLSKRAIFTGFITGRARRSS